MLLELVPSSWVLPSLGAVGTPSNIFALAMLLWYVGSWLVGRVTAAPGSRSPRVAMVFLAASMLIAYTSLAQSDRAPLSTELQAADRGLIGLAAWIGVVVVASAGIGDYETLQKLLRRAVLMGAAVGALGIFESFTHSNPIASIHIPGLNPVSTSDQFLERAGLTRPSSTASHPLELAGVLTMLLPFAIQQAFDPARQGRARKWLPVVLIGGMIPLTVSRTSIIGLLVALVFLLPTWKPARRRGALGVIVIGSVGVKVAVPGLGTTVVNMFSALLGGGDDSTTARTQDYAGVAPYIQERLWFGRGYGTFIPSLYRFTDNMYLHSMIEIGLIGTLAIMALYVVGYRAGRVGRRLSTEDTRRELGQSFAAAMAVAFVVSATFDSLTFPMFAGVVLLLLGCAGSYLGIIRNEPPPGLPEPVTAQLLQPHPDSMYTPVWGWDPDTELAGEATAEATAEAESLLTPPPSPPILPSEADTAPDPDLTPDSDPDLNPTTSIPAVDSTPDPDPHSDAETTLALPRTRSSISAPITDAPTAWIPLPIPDRMSISRADLETTLILERLSFPQPTRPTSDEIDDGEEASCADDKTLGENLRSGVRWSFINSLVIRIGTFLTGIVLARGLLTPRDWGLYAIGLTALAVLLSANELGVSLAIVRWEGEVRDFAPTVLTLSVGFSGFLYAILFAVAPVVAHALHAPDAIAMLRVLGISVIVDGVTCVPMALLTRQFEQRKRMIIDFANFLAGTALTIALAMAGFGAMSFAWGSFAGHAVVLAGCALAAPGMLRPGWNREQARRLLGFGLPLAGTSLLVLAMLNVDSVVVGAILGPVQLGLYQIAFNVSSWPVRAVSEVARRVSFAGFSRVADSPQALAESFRRGLELLMAAAVPACVILATLPKPVLHVVYGDKWVDASGALRFLALLGLLRVSYELAYDCLVAAGKKRALLIVQGWWLLALVPVLLYTARNRGIAGVGFGHMIVAGPLVAPLFVWALGRGGVPARAVLRACARPFLGGLAMTAVCLGVQRLGLGSTLELLLAGVLAAAVYVPFVWPLRGSLRGGSGP
ncbi:MAG TPA: oligosaccharide flippase family protein [Actinocrinis sp.]|nr:oligosaccharide flippase family protein [Actinocrinis sp.]